jgi:putative OPT family oligopeptide transporter
MSMSAPAKESGLATSEKSPTGFKPYVPDDERMPEFTISALLLGTSLGLIFAASSLYLVLKVGMTVSASIPVAVLAITVFRGLSRAFGLRRRTILENNIVQTSGSAGESIAFGVGVTMPALLFLGFEMDLARVMVVSILGGILGILAMIPLRRAFIVRMHGRPGEPGTLLYPEGVAAAQVLISGEKGGTTGATVFMGLGIAFAHKFATVGLNLLQETIKVPITVVNNATRFAGDMASELLGVGYIIGVRTSSIMMAGAVLGYLVIIPTIYFSGINAAKPVPPGNQTIQAWEEAEKKDPENNDLVTDIRNNYLLYIGAGCVAAAGLISMTRTLPMIVRSVRSGLASVRGARGDNSDLSVRRTENDMSMRVVIFGSLGLLVLLSLFLTAEVGIKSAVLGALLVLLFGFLFVTVSARLTGEIGSSSNPISGMTVATLMVTCLIFLALGLTGPRERLLALSVAAVVCIAASNGGTTAQSLKTGFLVGGTPKLMQYAILVGALVSALVIGGTLLAFNNAGTVYSDDQQYLPKDSRTGQVVVLTAQERNRLEDRETYKGKDYLIWDTRRAVFTKEQGDPPALVMVPDGTAPEGRFLVDPDTGRVSWLKDPTIGGIIKKHDDRETTRFGAPKTRVMTIIIEGVLKRKLNWSLVLIGAMIAVALELCGVSSLAFAVGVYVPIQYSVPIFIGGILRWGIDKYQASQSAAQIQAAGDDPEARARAEIEAIRKSETSPGVLLASGYIAGGSIAGVVAAFLEFAPSLKKSIDFGSVQTSLTSTLTRVLPSDMSWLANNANALIALALFSILIVFAVLVGAGKILQPPAEEQDASAAM